MKNHFFLDSDELGKVMNGQTTIMNTRHGYALIHMEMLNFGKATKMKSELEQSLQIGQIEQSYGS